MAEGGMLPWKVKRDNTKYVDYSGLQKPLSKPPNGFSWIHDENDGTWQLLNEATGAKVLYIPTEEDQQDSQPAKAQKLDTVEAEKEDLPDYLEHVVMPDDTLQGICLRYKIKANVLRRCNGFIGDHFRTEKILRIPTEHLRNAGTVFVPQSRTNDVLIQLFMGETNIGSIEARLYLDDHDWDMKRALEAWKADEDWEQAQMMKNESNSNETKTSDEKSKPTEPVVTVSIEMPAIEKN
jgi:LysM repeat protein